MLSILRNAQDLSSISCIARNHYGDWPIRYHLCPERSALLRPFDLSGLDVLELGSGMGGVSRYIAESCKTLTIVEGAASRLAACRERLRDLSNWTSRHASIDRFETDQRYDVVCLIGVLEYADVTGHGPDNRFDAMLAKVKSLCRPGGVLILAIENRLGLKYWAGASEDHLGDRFAGLAGYPDKPAPRTFSRKELKRMLNRNGFPAVREYFPFPDYKIPDTVMSAEMIEHEPLLASELATIRPFEDYSRKRLNLFPESLAAQSVAEAGLLADMSNSFLMLAAVSDQSSTMERLCRAEAAGEVAWHYALSNRTDPIVTIFQAAEAGMLVSKQALSQGHAAAAVEWTGEAGRPVLRHPTLLSRLRRLAYFTQWQEFENLVKEFFEWSFRQWPGDSDGFLAGKAVDATIANITIDEQGEFHLFDLEWTWHQPVAASWFILRSLLGIHQLQAGGGARFPHLSLATWYESLCRDFGIEPRIDRDLASEVAFRSAVCGALDPHRLRSEFDAAVASTFIISDSTRLGFEASSDRDEERAGFAARLAALEADRARWISQRDSLTFVMAASFSRHLDHFPAVKRLLKKIVTARWCGPESDVGVAARGMER